MSSVFRCAGELLQTGYRDDTQRLIMYRCVPDNTSILTNFIRTFNLIFFFGSRSVNIYPYPFTAENRKTALYLSLYYNRFSQPPQLIINSIENAIGPTNPIPLTFTVRMINFPVFYTFTYDPGSDTLTSSSINGSESFPLISFDNIVNGADIPSLLTSDNLSQSPPLPITSNSIRSITSVQPIRNNIVNYADVFPPPFPPADICDPTQIPRIIITHLNVAHSVFSSLEFSVFDTVPAMDSKLICPNEGIYQTNFVKHPQFQIVLKGPNSKKCVCASRKTLSQKINYLIKAFDISVTNYDFTYLLGFYASTRYILSGLLYGEFNVKWLLGKYYQRFLIRLANSKFYKFLIIFTNSDPEINFVGYEKYFLFDFDIVGPSCKKICAYYGNTYKCKITINSNFST